jgi:hypothetical protein
VLRLILCFSVLFVSSSAAALSPAAREFIEVSKQLEPVQCDKRKLRREIALAEAERRDAAALRARFTALDRDPRTAKLEQRLAQLQPRLSSSRDEEDLAAVSRHYREAFYRCEQ